MAIGALIAAPLSIVIYDVALQIGGIGWAILLLLLSTVITITGIRIRDNLDFLDVLFIIFTLLFEFSSIKNIAALMPVCVLIDIAIALFAEFGIEVD
jgi:hypothetical protein